jgi:nucleoside-diphosphate-sugar epimerase
MKILFTGGSSFTGYWFIRELAKAGHEVHATFTARAPGEYQGVRAERVRMAMECCTPVFDCAFGRQRFIELIQGQPGWDVFCHHAADVTNYKSPEFDVCGALSANTANARLVLETLKSAGCGRMVLTGSVFEQNEGLGEQPVRAFSPYGLSKGLTSEVFQYWCQHYGLPLGKFVIPNPFGPFEEPRFTTYLAKTWLHGRKAGVNTPAYVRDNIHVSLLALAYRAFAEGRGGNATFARCNPSGYVESQGAFARRFASEMEARLGVSCALDLAVQEVFEEPRVRINCDPVDGASLGWDESAAWDELADYYLKKLKEA